MGSFQFCLWRSIYRGSGDIAILFVGVFAQNSLGLLLFPRLNKSHLPKHSICHIDRLGNHGRFGGGAMLGRGFNLARTLLLGALFGEQIFRFISFSDFHISIKTTTTSGITCPSPERSSSLSHRLDDRG